jgi:hypothetical protein
MAYNLQTGRHLGEDELDRAHWAGGEEQVATGPSPTSYRPEATGSNCEEPQDESQDGSAEDKKKPGRVSAIFVKLGLDAPTLMTMFKFAETPSKGR